MENPKRRSILLGGFILALLALICFQSARAEGGLFEYVGTSHSVLGKVGMDARAASLAWAVTSLDMGVAGMEFNPASLAFRRTSQLAFGHSRWVEDVPLDQVLYAHPLPGRSTLAFGLLYMDMGRIRETLVDGSYTGRSLGASDMQFSVNYTLPLTRMIRAGGRASFLYKRLGDDSAGTFMGSFGLLSRELQGIRLGASMTDIGPPLKFRKSSFASPWRYRLGASHRLQLARGHSLLNSLDLIYPQDNHPSVGFGSEWTWNELLYLRVGYRRSVSDDGTPEGDRFHYGLGLRAGHFRLDYSYGSRADFQGVHRLSVTFDLGGDREGPATGSEFPADGPPSEPRLSESPAAPTGPKVEPADPVTVFSDLAFTADRSELLSGQNPMLDEFVLRLLAVPSLKGIELQGYEDSSGEASWDRKRSLQKLLAFKAALVARGISEDRIGLLAYGSDRNGDAESPARIEVHLIR